MNWPKTLIDAFDVALTNVDLVEGYTKPAALQSFLDQAASMAVWRCKGEPAGLESAYFWPYTPIGHLTNTGLGGTMHGFGLGGSTWKAALDELRAFVRENAADICTAYEGRQTPYPCQM